MKRFFPGVFFLAVLLLHYHCESPNEPALLTVSVASIGPVYCNGPEVWVAGYIHSNKSISSIAWSILDSSYSVITAEHLHVHGASDWTHTTEVDLNDDFQLRLSADSLCPTGSYFLTVTASANGISSADTALCIVDRYSPSLISILVRPIETLRAEKPYAEIEGTIVADSALSSVDMTISYLSGVPVDSSQITVYNSGAFTTTDSIDLSSHLSTKITASTQAVPGTYLLNIIAHSGTIQARSSTVFNVVRIKPLTISISLNPVQPIPAGSMAYLIGTIDADTIISTISCKVYDSTSSQTNDSIITVTCPQPAQSNHVSFSSTNKALLRVHSTALPGNHTLVITASAGIIVHDTLPFIVLPASTEIPDTATLTLGSYDNPSLGASCDLDKGLVLMAPQATALNSGTDLVGTYSTAKSAMRIFSPDYARDISNITAFSVWPDAAPTRFVWANVPGLESITSTQQMEQLYNASATVYSSASCQLYDIFIVKTDQQSYAAIQIIYFDATTNGIFMIKWLKFR
jgi:hypothetical protein